MALLWCDIPDRSLGLYGTTEAFMDDGLYAQNRNSDLVDDPDPDIGSAGRVIRLNPGSASFPAVLRWVLPGTRTTVGMGNRLYLNEIPRANDLQPEFHTYRDVGNNREVSIAVSPVGSIRVYRGDRTDTIIAESAQGVINANEWRHVESEVTFSATVGVVKVWVEGIEVINETGLNTGSDPCAQVAWFNDSDATSDETVTYIKDLFIRDDQGSQNNGQIGTCTVYLLKPNADVSSGWTRTSGTTDYELLDNAPPDDAEYISAADPPPAASITELENLPADITSVRGIISLARVRKTDSGDGNIQVSLSPNGTDWDTGADAPTTTTFSYYHDVSELSPATGSPWTPVEADAATIRINRTV